MTFFDDINRSIELGKLGIAAKRVKDSEKGDADQDALRSLVDNMATLRGLPQKIGQILSLKELNSERSQFLKLTEGAPQLAATESYALIDKELGCSWKEHFAELSPEGVSASLGQVHRGTTHAGEDVAVKIQYPGIEGALKHDLKALGLLALPLTGKQRGFHLKEYRETLSQSLLTELDYRQELAALERFQEYRKSEPAVISPKPYRELSTERLLTMSWVSGFPIESTKRWDFSERLFIARTLTRLFLKEWLLWGEIHADPHSGNYRFQRSSNGIQVGLLDFGCVKRLSANESSALRSLLEWGDSRTQNLLEMYTQLGFNRDLLEPIEKKLPQMTELILEPILSKRPFLVSEWQISKRMSAILGEDRWNFRIAGPPSLIFFIRAFSGVMQQLEFLSVPINWSVELERVLGSEPARTRKETSNRDSSKTKQSTAQNLGDPQRASQLKIAVLENGLPKVQLSFKPHLVTQLHLLMDSELFAKLASRGIEVEELAKTAVESGLKKQELFSLSEDSKDFRVWLE